MRDLLTAGASLAVTLAVLLALGGCAEDDVIVTPTGVTELRGVVVESARLHQEEYAFYPPDCFVRGEVRNTNPLDVVATLSFRGFRGDGSLKGAGWTEAWVPAGGTASYEALLLYGEECYKVTTVEVRIEKVRWAG